jgi:hypothetical protein
VSTSRENHPDMALEATKLQQRSGHASPSLSSGRRPPFGKGRARRHYWLSLSCPSEQRQVAEHTRSELLVSAIDSQHGGHRLSTFHAADCPDSTAKGHFARRPLRHAAHRAD